MITTVYLTIQKDKNSPKIVMSSFKIKDATVEGYGLPKYFDGVEQSFNVADSGKYWFQDLVYYHTRLAILATSINSPFLDKLKEKELDLTGPSVSYEAYKEAVKDDIGDYSLDVVFSENLADVVKLQSRFVASLWRLNQLKEANGIIERLINKPSLLTKEEARELEYQMVRCSYDKEDLTKEISLNTAFLDVVRPKMAEANRITKAFIVPHLE